MQTDDVYKLIHQACLGSHHLVSNVAGADAWLTRELANLTEGPVEPMVDPISPDGRIVRVHLRPFVAHGGDPDHLLEALVRTANEFEGSIDQIRILWRSAEEMTKDGHLPFLEASLVEFGERMEGLKHPAVHHSEAYRAAYHPAYRVIAKDFLTITMAGDG
jgi:hypothetical protein